MKRGLAGLINMKTTKALVQKDFYFFWMQLKLIGKFSYQILIIELYLLIRILEDSIEVDLILLLDKALKIMTEIYKTLIIFKIFLESYFSYW